MMSDYMIDSVKYLHKSLTVYGEPVPQGDFLRARTTLRRTQGERLVFIRSC